MANNERFDALTYEIFDPTGQFYERRLMLPDVLARAHKIPAKQTLGEKEAIVDVAEVLCTGLAFAKTLKIADEHHELCFSFRWSGLQGRIVDDCVRRQNIWHIRRRKLAESGPRLGFGFRRRACGVASVDVRWSVA